MKHWLIYLVFTAGVIVLGALPFENHDVGELRPVETILATRQNGQVHIQTDTGDQGTGHNWTAALEDMRHHAPGSLFAATGSFLLLGHSGEDLAEELAEYRELNPNCAICLTDERQASQNLAEIGPFLQAHPPEVTLRDLRAAKANHQRQTLPQLICENGGYLLVQPEN